MTPEEKLEFRQLRSEREWSALAKRFPDVPATKTVPGYRKALLAHDLDRHARGLSLPSGFVPTYRESWEATQRG